ncbi:G5 domain-containing protein [Kribbella sp. NPDC026611]|uniref:G5 domain-containing protein n=1 Tax=Kribbella sp. NPDC026611 TaxID=3154911 RepID=UPI0033CAEEA2
MAGWGEIVFYVRAALGLLGVGALATGCGGTGSAADPAPVASVVSVAPKAGATAAGPGSKVSGRTISREIVQYQIIPFKKKTVTDDSLLKGQRTVRTVGVNGTRRLVYRVTIVGGRQTAKHLVRQEVYKQPRTQVTAVGTKVEEPVGSTETTSPSEESGCDPNYSGCVPIASDVDCSGGSGNGPEYVAGPVRVVGRDIYRLDADGDGVGCED